MRNTTPISPAVRARIRLLGMDAGKPCRAIAARFGVSKSSVARILRSYMPTKLASLHKIESLRVLTPNERDVLGRMTTAELAMIASLIERKAK